MFVWRGWIKTTVTQGVLMGNRYKNIIQFV